MVYFCKKHKIMDVNKIINRAKGLIINPAKEWDIINNENIDKTKIIKEYALPLIILASISTLIGSFGSPKFLSPSISYSVISAFVTLAVSVVSIYISSYIINEIAPNFGLQKDLNKSFKLVIYSSTPAYLASIIANLHWTLGFLNILGVYSVYLFWLGSSQILNIQEDKKVGFVILSFVVLLVVYLVLAVLLGGIILSTAFTFK